ncbi:hypothetical protein LPJ53_002037 [Coemansia erecta]|uniref:PAS domain-containing protein n=1 Tax=Coemansia erecta TaxID=147472 RepID=A0A9W8CS88_9FUNG|nr:hypothetical protein LPJ53_002037 [Coemansia erecta]
MSLASAETSGNRRNNVAAESRRGRQIFLAVHDKTPELRVLYISSNVRQVIKYQPSEVVGQPSLGFMSQSSLDFYKTVFTDMRQDEVMVSHMRVMDRNENPVYLRVMHFNCDNMAFNVNVTRPDAGGSRVEDEFIGSQHRLSRRPVGGMVIHGCLVLENQAVELNGLMGPRILFASRSFGRMLDVDTSDIQGSRFLSLVAPRDVLRASAFLEQMDNSMDVVVERLGMCVGYWNETDVRGGVAEIEIMAAGSDDGAMLLCQMEQCASDRAGGVDGDHGYVSLEELVSSDPETSDVAGWWQSNSME